MARGAASRPRRSSAASRAGGDRDVRHLLAPIASPAKGRGVPPGGLRARASMSAVGGQRAGRREAMRGGDGPWESCGSPPSRREGRPGPARIEDPSVRRALLNNGKRLGRARWPAGRQAGQGGARPLHALVVVAPHPHPAALTLCRASGRAPGPRPSRTPDPRSRPGRRPPRREQLRRHRRRRPRGSP